jgi:hypothetical protein
LQDLPKFTQIGIFGLKVCTPPEERRRLVSKHLKVTFSSVNIFAKSAKNIFLPFLTWKNSDENIDAATV